MRLLLLVLLVLVGCESDPYGEPLTGEGCVSGDPLEVTVMVLEDGDAVREVHARYLKELGQEDIKGLELQAFCALRIGENKSTCFLPKVRGQEDDENIFLWGHEFLHVVCGQWHPEDFIAVR